MHAAGSRCAKSGPDSSASPEAKLHSRRSRTHCRPGRWGRKLPEVLIMGSLREGFPRGGVLKAPWGT